MVPGFSFPFCLCNFLSNLTVKFNPFLVVIPPYFIISEAIFETFNAASLPAFRIIKVSKCVLSSFKYVSTIVLFMSLHLS